MLSSLTSKNVQLSLLAVSADGVLLFDAAFVTASRLLGQVALPLPATEHADHTRRPADHASTGRSPCTAVELTN